MRRQYSLPYVLSTWLSCRNLYAFYLPNTFHCFILFRKIRLLYFAHSWNFFDAFTFFAYFMWSIAIKNNISVFPSFQKRWQTVKFGNEWSLEIMHIILKWRNALENFKYWQNPTIQYQLICEVTWDFINLIRCDNDCWYHPYQAFFPQNSQL